MKGWFSIKPLGDGFYHIEAHYSDSNIKEEYNVSSYSLNGVAEMLITQGLEYIGKFE